MKQGHDWFNEDILWSSPVSIARLNENRSQIPNGPGIYVFTNGSGQLISGQVLYVGQAVNLSNRLKVYITKDFYRKASPLPNGKEEKFHKGRALILDARLKNTDRMIYIRWGEISIIDDRARLNEQLDLYEANVIGRLNPDCNSRDEEQYHPMFD